MALFCQRCRGFSMSEAAVTTPRRARSVRLMLVILLLSVGRVCTSRAEPGSGPASANPVSDVGSLFQARKRLEAMGIRDLAPATPADRSVVIGARGVGAPLEELYRARITAPTLAFAHGLCDDAGGLPKYGESIAVAVRPGGLVELRASVLGQLLDVADHPTHIWVWDAGRLADRTQLRRTGEPRSR